MVYLICPRCQLSIRQDDTADPRDRPTTAPCPRCERRDHVSADMFASPIAYRELAADEPAFGEAR